MEKTAITQSVCVYQPAQIRTLTDAQATRTHILSEFDNCLIHDTSTGDKVLFYYSGHGTYVKDNWKGDETDGYDEALCPINATPSTEFWEFNSRATAIPAFGIIVRLKEPTGGQAGG